MSAPTTFFWVHRTVHVECPLIALLTITMIGEMSHLGKAEAVKGKGHVA